MCQVIRVEVSYILFVDLMMYKLNLLSIRTPSQQIIVQKQQGHLFHKTKSLQILSVRQVSLSQDITTLVG